MAIWAIRGSDIETPDPNNPGQVVQQHVPLIFKELKQLKEAVSSYGPLAPFAVSMFKSYASLNLMPSDWQQLWHAVLSGGDYLLWKEEYQEKYIQTACLNVQAGFPKKKKKNGYADWGWSLCRPWGPNWV